MYLKGEVKGPLGPKLTGIFRVLWIDKLDDKLSSKMRPRQDMIGWTLMAMIPLERLEETALYICPHRSQTWILEVRKAG